jgi:hypothetical protein
VRVAGAADLHRLAATAVLGAHPLQLRHEHRVPGDLDPLRLDPAAERAERLQAVRGRPRAHLDASDPALAQLVLDDAGDVLVADDGGTEAVRGRGNAVKDGAEPEVALLLGALGGRRALPGQVALQVADEQAAGVAGAGVAADDGDPERVAAARGGIQGADPAVRVVGARGAVGAADVAQ